MLRVLAAGPLTTVQDLGRPGHAALGVSPSGAADRAALRAANRLVGNRVDSTGPGAAGLEVTYGGLALRAEAAVHVALTGAVCPIALDGPWASSRAGFGVAFAMRAGDELRLGRPDHGLRTYVAVGGGVAAAVTFGSRSTDLLSGLGPAPLAPGDLIRPADDVDSFVPTDVPGRRRFADASGSCTVSVVRGPRDDWASADELGATVWTVLPTSDRIGIRLGGAPLARRPGELRPEGLVRGAIQVPPDGRPVVVFADHPVTGGYPVVAVVTDADLDHLAQLRPGDPLRFTAVR